MGEKGERASGRERPQARERGVQGRERPGGRKNGRSARRLRVRTSGSMLCCPACVCTGLEQTLSDTSRVQDLWKSKCRRVSRDASSCTCAHAHTHARTYTHARTRTRAHARARALSLSRTRARARAHTHTHTRTHTHRHGPRGGAPCCTPALCGGMPRAGVRGARVWATGQGCWVWAQVCTYALCPCRCSLSHADADSAAPPPPPPAFSTSC